MTCSFPLFSCCCFRRCSHTVSSCQCDHAAMRFCIPLCNMSHCQWQCSFSSPCQWLVSRMLLYQCTDSDSECNSASGIGDITLKWCASGVSEGTCADSSSHTGASSVVRFQSLRGLRGASAHLTVGGNIEHSDDGNSQRSESNHSVSHEVGRSMVPPTRGSLSPLHWHWHWHWHWQTCFGPEHVQDDDHDGASAHWRGKHADH